MYSMSDRPGAGLEKRRFLLAAAATAAASGPAHAASARDRRGPGLLTVTGAVARANRGPLDPALDQLMLKHGARFDKAWVLDAAQLAQLPSQRIQPMLEYDARPHTLSGPLLSTVVEAAGVDTASPVMLALRALDGYTVALSLADARRFRMLVATQLDGRPMSVGGLGPQWAVYDADRIADFKDKPLKERFALCPWGLYHIEVQPR